MDVTGVHVVSGVVCTSQNANAVVSNLHNVRFALFSAFTLFAHHGTYYALDRLTVICRTSLCVLFCAFTLFAQNDMNLAVPRQPCAESRSWGTFPSRTSSRGSSRSRAPPRRPRTSQTDRHLGKCGGLSLQLL